MWEWRFNLCSMLNKNKLAKRDWAMTAKHSSSQNTFELKIRDVEGLKLPLDFTSSSSTVNLNKPYKAMHSGIRITYSSGVLKYEGLSSIQVEKLARNFLRAVGFSQQDVLAMGVTLNSPFFLRVVHFKGTAVLNGANLGRQGQLPLGKKPWIKVTRHKANTYSVKFYDLASNQDYLIRDNNGSICTFKVTQVATEYLNKGRLETGSSPQPVIVMLGFKNVVDAVNDMCGLNRWSRPLWERPYVKSSISFML